MKRQIIFNRQIIFLAGFVILLMCGTANAQNIIQQNEERESLMKKFSQILSAENSPTDESFYNQRAKLTANDGAHDDNFASDIAIAGDTAVVGVYRDDVGANADQGSAYVFVRSSAGVWNFQQKLTANDGAAGDNFGWTVAIADASFPKETVITVGAFGNDSNGIANKGAVYVFRRSASGTTWTQQQKLIAADGLENDVFGASVAMTGSFAVIGANGVDVGANGSQGAAYIFVRNGSVWEQEQKLTAQSGKLYENLGWSVDISGTTVIVGTNQQQTGVSGSAYIFVRQTGGNTWNQQAKINSGQKFGTSVAISGDTAVVGDLQATVGSNLTQGKASVFTRTGTQWSSQASLTASDGASGDEFGRSVAISGNKIVVGAHFDTLGGSNFQGSAYVFTRSGNVWTESRKLLDYTGAIGDRFGNSVAINGDTIMVGAWEDDVGSVGQAGSASVFRFLNSAAPFDFDGDGKTDLSVFRPTTGEWFVTQSSTDIIFSTQFGTNSDRLVPGYYTTDGKADIAFWQPSNGQWNIRRSESSILLSFQFGLNGDIPAPADYDADGKTDAAVFRPSNTGWYIQKSTGGTDSVTFGLTNDLPTPADYDGDGKSDIAITRISNGNREWWIRKSSNGQIASAVFGLPEDKTAPGDYTGDGKADLAFFRPSNGTWYVLRSENQTFFSVQWGQNGDIPVAGDYDADGKFDYAVFRPSNSGWYISKSAGGTTIVSFGLSGDTPVPSVFVR